MAKRPWTVTVHETILKDAAPVTIDVERPDCPLRIDAGHLIVESGPGTIVAVFAPDCWASARAVVGKA